MKYFLGILLILCSLGSGVLLLFGETTVSSATKILNGLNLSPFLIIFLVISLISGLYVIVTE